MTNLPKAVPVRLDIDFHRRLRLRVLERDGWRCQICGSMRNLEVHHTQFRSHQGEDTEDNLITLCVQCHKLRHSWTRNR
jgi:5-methylcytosine-specific restriction endonuclease McrA